MTRTRDENLREIAEFVKTNSISLRALPERFPGRLSFEPLPGFSETLNYERGLSFPTGSYRIKSCGLSGAYGIICVGDPQGSLVLEEQNGHTDVVAGMGTFPNPCSEGPPPVLSSAVSLVAAASYCFYHWMLDSLPKVMMAEAIGFTGSYVVPAPNVNPWVQETMSMLGVGPERLLPLTHRLVVVEDLWIPTHFLGYRLHEYPAFHRWVRERFLATAHSIAETPDRLFIPRRPSHRGRSIANFDQVCAVLKEFKFAVVYMEDFPVRQQIGIASRARAMVGPHGSAMLHALFMPENSLLLEFFASDLVNGCMGSAAQTLGHRYARMESPAYPLRDQQLYSDVHVDCDALRFHLERELG